MIWRDWNLQVDVDQVLRAQDADPAALRRRRSPAVDVAEEAVERGARLLEPAAAFVTAQVEAFRHGQLWLDGGARLSGPLITRRLFSSQYLVAAVCTIGPRLEAEVTACVDSDAALGVALDGFGSAAIQVLGTALQAKIRADSEAQGLSATAPLSPGYEGWSVLHGQPQLFGLVDAAAIDVRLNDGMMMVPHKSISLVMGLGTDVVTDGDPCDFCAVADRCRFRETGGHQVRPERCRA